MDRNWESGASGTPPSLATLTSNGYATEGDPSTAVPATKPGAGWFHMITEEMRAVLVAGSITPDHTLTNQLLAAIQALVVTGARAILAEAVERMFGGRDDMATPDTSFVIVPGSSIIEVDATGLDALTQEVHCMAYVAGGTGSIRLWDITAGAQVGATTTFVNTGVALTKITGLAGLLAHALHQYRLETKGAAGTDLPTVYGGRLVIK